MGWQRGEYEGPWFTGTGRNRKGVVGATVYFGPRGQRYIMRYRGSSNKLYYNWGNWDEVSDTLTDLDAATEQDWNLFWEMGPYRGSDSYEEPQPTQQQDQTPNLSYLKDNRTELTAAAIIAAIVLIVVIARA